MVVATNAKFLADKVEANDRRDCDTRTRAQLPTVQPFGRRLMSNAGDGVDPNKGRAGPSLPSTSGPAPEADGSQFMISQTAGWIVNADTKAGLLLTALALLGAALAGQLNSTLNRLSEFDTRLGTALALFAGAAVLLGTSVFHIYRVLIPRTNQASLESRYSWPWLARQNPKDLLHRRPEEIRLEAWVQAITLSGIANAKFSAFRAALRFAIIGSVLLLAGSVVGF